MLHGPSFRLSLRRIVGSRKFLFAALVSLLPLVFGALFLVDAAEDARYRQERGETVDYDAYVSQDYALLLLGGTVPLAALLLAGGMLADDVEDRTLSYLLVRPVKRTTQYLSRLAAVAVATGGLALLQALQYALFTWLEWLFWYRGTEYVLSQRVVGPNEFVTQTTASGPIVAGLILAVLAAAPLAAAGLSALFGFVSILTTRFHFLANLILYASWELPFGVAAPALGPGLFTISYAATSLVESAVPNRFDEPQGLPLALAVAMLLFWTTVWGLAGAQWMRRKDFTVTSANS